MTKVQATAIAAVLIVLVLWWFLFMGMLVEKK